MLVPERALAFLAAENISFQVEGPATYEQVTLARGRTFPSSQ
jgi:hypothetical protein